jgi:hypothetical protein
VIAEIALLSAKSGDELLTGNRNTMSVNGFPGHVSTLWPSTASPPRPDL